jgi:uncharacterized protein
MHFRDAISRLVQLETYKAPGERVLSLVDVDPRKRANEALVGLCASFLDRGAAKWAPRFRDRGFLHFFAVLEGLGSAWWRSHARAVAERILAAGLTADDAGNTAAAALAEAILRENAVFFGVPPEDYEKLLYSTLLELPGWAGMFHRMETHAREAPAGVRVRLLEFCAVQSTLARTSVDDAARHAGARNSRHRPWSPLSIAPPPPPPPTHCTHFPQAGTRNARRSACGYRGPARRSTTGRRTTRCAPSLRSRI